LNNYVEQLEDEIQSLNDKIRDLDKVSNNSGYVETLQVQIAQKDHDIHKLEFENNQNIQIIQQLKTNLAEKESQLTTTAQDNNDLDIYNRTQQLEQYVEELEQYYLEELEQYPDININSPVEDLEQYLQEIADKDTCIRKLKSENCKNIDIINLLENNILEQESKLKIARHTRHINSSINPKKIKSRIKQDRKLISLLINIL
jgi:hypothetical protein